jgi:hypothetical protein
MKKVIAIVSAVCILAGVPGCMVMNDNRGKARYDGTNYSNPSKHHPYPVQRHKTSNKKLSRLVE